MRGQFLNRFSLSVIFFIIVVCVAMFVLKKIKDKAFTPIDEPVYNRENMEYTLRIHLLKAIT